MHLRLLPLAAFLFLIPNCANQCPSCASAGGASKTATAPAGERKAVLASLRTGREASFQVHRLNIKGDWAYADVTPLNNSGKPVAEGGPHVLHRMKTTWKDLDLTKVPADPKDPLGAEDNSPGWVRNVQKTYPGVPADIFPKASH